MRKEKTARRPWIIFLALGLVVFFSAFLGFLFALGTHFALFEILVTFLPAESFLSNSNIIILGQDEAGFAKRADTIILARIESAQKTVRLLSVPRDTRVPIPGYGQDKVNHSFAYGGAPLTQRTLQEWLDIPIPYYVSVDLGGLAKFIDHMGGIEMNVEKKMHYADYAGGVFIDMDPGVKHLNGKQAVGYLRYRTDPAGDIGRIKRQQKFLLALLSQISKANPVQIPLSLVQLASHFETNLSSKEILGLAMVLRQAHELGQIETHTLEGYPKIYNGIFFLEIETETKDSVRKMMGVKENG